MTVTRAQMLTAAHRVCFGGCTAEDLAIVDAYSAGTLRIVPPDVVERPAPDGWADGSNVR